ncbi:glycosyltransferase [Streptomyces pactum]|uniref:Glycosyltransferase n=1 Tax=Streptomyces pactum TaxID=68249 RepID=A0ABS0NL39_9ACTN|nr:glycosyltransferase [Streptomyces pactum]MBH5335907.1 glycosyltransferase [Streptomyces pactum]
MPDSVGLSVIVPSHNGREAMTMRLIDTYIDSARYATLPSELVIVDSSDRDEAADLEKYCDRHGVRYLRGPRPAGVKRNQGVAAARYDALLFVDSDCMLTPASLREHERIFELPESVGAVTGAVDLHGPITPLWKVLDWSGMYSQCFDHPRQYEQVLWGVTANICVRRSAFERCGRFDEDIVTPVGGEDVDFGVRITESGFTIRTNPDALVRHAREHVTVRHVARSMLTYGRADTYLCQVHPERVETYVDPACAGAIGLAAGALLHRRKAPALAWGAAAWAVTALKRQTAQPYTPDQGEAPRVTGAADVPRRVAAGLLDTCFDVGRLAEAISVRRFDLLLKRFRYVDPESFIPRRAGSSTTQVASDADR